MPAMLLCSGLTGLFVLNALGIWVTLFNPRKGNYNSNFGNDLSLGGNIVLIGGMLVAQAAANVEKDGYSLYATQSSTLSWKC